MTLDKISVGIAGATVMIYACMIVGAIAVVASVAGTPNYQQGAGMNAFLLIAGLCVLGAPVLSLMGLGFGIAAMRQPPDMRGLATLGVAANGVILFVTICCPIMLMVWNRIYEQAWPSY